MSEKYGNSEPESPAADTVDEDPPRESDQLREVEDISEPADDDPPVEPRSPWNEVEAGVRQGAPTDSSPDDDPPSEPRSVRSIPHAPVNRIERA
jgi:hypothetical protein